MKNPATPPNAAPMTLPMLDQVAPVDDLAPVLRRVVRFGWAALLITLLALLSFVALASIEGAVVASGSVKVDLNRRVVQHREGGSVSAVHVRDGQRVEAGQLLLELTDTEVQASVGLLRHQHEAELARSARLEAERSYATQVRWPATLTERREQPAVREIIGQEQALFTARRATLDSQLQVLRQQQREVEGEIAALESQLAIERQGAALQQEELRLNERLVEQRYIDRARLLSLQRALIEYGSRIGAHEADLARARQKHNDLKLRLLALRNDYTEAAARDQRDSGGRLHEFEQRLQPSEDAARRQRIVAPVAGEVVGLKVFAAGTVIGPRDVLMEIVPVSADLIIEARVRPEDITRVRPGAAVDVRLTAFNHRETPVVPGQVAYISADTFSDGGNAAHFYTVQVQVSPAALAGAGHLYLQAGMPAEVYIRTRRRSIASYLMEPVGAYLSRALREN
ncbi:MAG: hypothetical protein RJA44_126 [Pseudomonadota bacterium]